MTKALQSPDFYANEYAPAHRSNYTAGRLGESIDKIVVHVTQGSFASAYNWCQRPEANVSWHYLMAQNGRAAQQLSEKFMGWHAGNLEFNKTSVGIEHAGYISDRSMWTEAMYRNSAKIAAGIIHRAPGIPNDRFGYHLWAHSSIPGSTHTDPGRYFDWDKYIELIAGFLKGEQAPVKPKTLYRPRSGLFSEMVNADALAQEQKAKGFAASTEPHGKYWAVFNGAFSEMDGAKTTVNALHRAGYREAFIEAVEKS